MVVALSAHEPLGLADEVFRVARIDADIRFGVVLDELRRGRRIAGIASRLGRVRTLVLAGVRRALTGAHAGVAVVWAVARGELSLRRVAAGLLGRRDDVLHLVRGIAGRVVAVALRPLWKRRARQRRRRRSGGRRREHEKKDRGRGDRDGATHGDLPKSVAMTAPRRGMIPAGSA